MGCDIHLHQEVKIHGVWHHYNHRNVDRNYELFGLMAGVRGKRPPIVEPRGLPADVTALTQFDATYWEGDAHHHSWLGASEVRQVLELAHFEDIYGVGEWFGYLFGNGWIGFLQYPEDRPEGLEDFRWVFWFDN